MKKKFQSLTEIPNLFELQQAPPQYSDIRDKLLQYCADSRDQLPHLSSIVEKSRIFHQSSFQEE